VLIAPARSTATLRLATQLLLADEGERGAEMFVLDDRGLLSLILTVAAVQTVGAAIVPGCFGNRGLSCRGTNSSNPAPSSKEMLWDSARK